MPPFAVQKAIFYKVKGNLLECKRLPFIKRLTARQLHACKTVVAAGAAWSRQMDWRNFTTASRSAFGRL